MRACALAILTFADGVVALWANLSLEHSLFGWTGGRGIYLSIRLKFFQIRYLPYIVKQTFGKIFDKGREKAR
ncbi:MAG: hypothetical protein LBB48_03075 [Treponema sp.]|nr:hypothetical protein [Treponema sp.]